MVRGPSKRGTNAHRGGLENITELTGEIPNRCGAYRGTDMGK